MSIPGIIAVALMWLFIVLVVRSPGVAVAIILLTMFGLLSLGVYSTVAGLGHG